MFRPQFRLRSLFILTGATAVVVASVQFAIKCRDERAASAAVIAFLDAMRKGDSVAACATLKGSVVTAACRPTARFAIERAEVSWADSTRKWKNARVSFAWTETQINGEIHTAQIACVLSREPNGWFIIDFAGDDFPLFAFWDAADAHFE